MISLFEKLFPTHKFRWQKRGTNAKGCCPFHGDKNPSMQIYTDNSGKQRWFCFSEKIGGREVDAVMRAEPTGGKCTRDAANRWLIKNGFLQETEVDVHVRVLNEARQKFFEWTHGLLVQSEAAKGLRAYIAGRNISKDTIENAPIGYYPRISEVEDWLSSESIPEDLHDGFLPLTKAAEAIASGGIIFFYRSSFDLWYRPKVRNPFKEIEGGGPKATIYLGKGNKFEGFFSGSIDNVQTEHAIMLEGEFDVLSMLSMCKKDDPDAIEPIYCFGSGGNIDTGVNLLTNVGIENIYMFPDNDKAGIDYAFEVAENHPHTYIVYPEDYEEEDDPAIWSGKHNFEDLQVAFRDRIPAFEWIGRRLAKQYQAGTSEDQSHAKDKVLEYARKLSPSNREMFLKTYAPLTGVSYEALWEEVQTADRIRYRKALDMDNYGIHMGLPKRGNKIEYEHISNVILEFEKDIIMDDGDDISDQPTEIADGGSSKESYGDQSNRQDRMLLIRIMMPTKERRIKVSSSEYTDDRMFYNILIREMGSDLWVKPKCLAFLKESATVLPTAKKKVEETIFTHTGWRGDKFLMPNGYVDAEGFHELGDIKVELPRNPPMFRRYRLDEPPADLSELIKVFREDMLQVFPYDITLPIAAHMFLAPIINIIPNVKPYCMWVQAVTGSFKTTYASMMGSLYGDFVRGDAIETWASTGNSLEKNGYFLKDCLYIIDDYKRANANDRQVISFVQSYGDMHGRARLRADQTQQQTWNVRGLILSTGEDLPGGEASVLARMIILPIKAQGNADKLTNGQKYAKFLPGMMAKYIQYVSQHREEISSWESYAQIIELSKRFNMNHKRVKVNFALNAFAWELMAKCFGLEDLSPQYYEGMNRLGLYMDVVTKSEQASSMYIELTKDLLSSGEFYLEGIRDGTDTDHFEYGKRLGFRSSEFVFLVGSATLAAVNALRTKLYGSGIKYSQGAIYDQLIADGHLVPQSGNPTSVIKVDKSSHRVLRLKRGVVDDIEESDSKPKFEGSEVCYPEKQADAD